MADKLIRIAMKSEEELGYDNYALSKTPPIVNIVKVKPKEEDIPEPVAVSSHPDSSVVLNKTVKSSESDSDSESIEEITLDNPINIKPVGKQIDDHTDHDKTNNKSLIFDKSKQNTVQNESGNIFADHHDAGYLILNNDPSIPIINPQKNLQKFLLTPPPKGVVVRCQINKTNRKDKTLLFTHFIFSLQITKANNNLPPELETLMAARSKLKSKTAHYIISTDPSEIKPNSSCTIGKLRSNFTGTRFRFFQRNFNADISSSQNLENDDNSTDDEDENGNGKDSCKAPFDCIGVLFYKNSKLGSSRPKTIVAALPKWEEKSETYNTEIKLPTEREGLNSNEGMSGKSFTVLNNLPPAYNKEKRIYTLDFGGRVKDTSVKNFALVMKDNETNKDKRVFQFGKAGDHFIVDYTYPFCALQAFGIGLSSLHRKLATD